MKQISILFTAAVLAMFAVSCEKAFDPGTKADEGSNVPEVYIRCSAQGPAFTKTTVNVNEDNEAKATVSWTKGDQIRVFGEDGSVGVFIATTDGPETDFKFQGFTEADYGYDVFDLNQKVVAVYPEDIFDTPTGREITLPEVQHYVEGTFDNGCYPMIAVGNPSAETLAFTGERSSAVLCFNIFNYDGDEVYVKSLRLAAHTALSGSALLITGVAGADADKTYEAPVSPWLADNATGEYMEENLAAGESTIRDVDMLMAPRTKADYNQDPVGRKYIAPCKGANLFLTLDCGEEGVLLSNDPMEPTPFYFVVPMRIQMGSSRNLEMSLEITTMDNHKMLVMASVNPYSANAVQPFNPFPFMKNYSEKNIAGVTWLNYNVGADVNNPYGKKFQWGRMDGCRTTYANEEFFTTAQGMMASYMNDCSGSGQVTTPGPISYVHENPAEFYVTDGLYDSWLSREDKTRWTVFRTEFNPCPEGWRLPTADEYMSLVHYRFAGEPGNTSFKNLSDYFNYMIACKYNAQSNTASGLIHLDGDFFLPAAGVRDGASGDYLRNSYNFHGFYWTSTVYDCGPMCFHFWNGRSPRLDSDGDGRDLEMADEMVGNPSIILNRAVPVITDSPIEMFYSIGPRPDADGLSVRCVREEEDGLNVITGDRYNNRVITF